MNEKTNIPILARATLSHAFAPTYGVGFKPSANYDKDVLISHKVSKGILLAVITAHALACGLILQAKVELPTADSPAKPMLVSLITPLDAAQKPEPQTPELVPIIEPPKPKPIPVKSVAKPKPVRKVVEENPTSPVMPEPVQNLTATTETEPVASLPVAEAPIEQAKVEEPPKVEEKIEPPKFGVAYLDNPAPEYPATSRRLGEEGRALLKVMVSESGVAKEVAIEKSSGYTRLDQAAIEAVKHWRFIPAKKGGQPLAAYVLVPLKFSLDQ